MATTSNESSTPTTHKKTIQLEGATVRLAGDSGDGMQLLGTQLTNTSALLGNDVATFPDYPAEIRAARHACRGQRIPGSILVAGHLHPGRSTRCSGGYEPCGSRD